MLLKQYGCSSDQSSPNSDLRVAVFEVDDYCVHIYFREEGIASLLTEAQRKGTPIGGIYSAAKHSRHTPEGKYHLHLYAKGVQIGAFNIDGTTHDAWHGHRLPNKVIEGIQKHFPDFAIPADGVLETVEPDVTDYILLLEAMK